MPETATAGATPAAAGATPTQTTPVSPAAAAPEPPAAPATGEPEVLGDAGKRAIDRMKAERDAAVEAGRADKKRIDELENASRTDQEKAIAKARQEASDEVTGKYQAQVRQARVEAALAAAGVEPSLIDLATNAGEFAKLKVTDDGKVEGLTEAIAALKKDRPALFKAPVAPGTADGGTRGAPGLTREALKKMSSAEVNALWAQDGGVTVTRVMSGG